MKSPTNISGVKDAKHQKATFCATVTLLASEKPELLAIIPLKADPNAIATRIKVGMDAEAWARSVSGTFAMIRLDTKLQDIPKPIPIMKEKREITQRGPTGMAYTNPSIEILTKTEPILISIGSKRSLNPEVIIAVRVHAKDSSAII